MLILWNIFDCLYLNSNLFNEIFSLCRREIKDVVNLVETNNNNVYTWFRNFKSSIWRLKIEI
jgi:hypothetical protein